MRRPMVEPLKSADACHEFCASLALFRQARYLLAEESEIRDPSLYHSVLAAVAEGNNTGCGIPIHRTGLPCTSLHRFRAAAVSYPRRYPKSQRSGVEML
jgi:hypothetical protein